MEIQICYLLANKVSKKLKKLLYFCNIQNLNRMRTYDTIVCTLAVKSPVVPPPGGSDDMTPGNRKHRKSNPNL